MELTGKLHAKLEVQVVSDRFSKRDLVIEFSDNPSYPQYISLQLTQDKCSILDNYNVGDNLRVEFNLRGRMWQSPQGETKYFNTLEAWRISPALAAGQGEAVNAAAPMSAPVVQGASKIDDLNDAEDLPF